MHNPKRLLDALYGGAKAAKAAKDGGAVHMQDGGALNLYRPYSGHSQEAQDWLNAQNLATGRPYEYDERTKTFTRQGESGPETIGWEQARDLGRQAVIDRQKQYFEASDPFKLNQGDQVNLDQYIKVALPNLLEEASTTGGYSGVNQFLSKYGVSDADVQRIFGQQAPSQDWLSRLNSGDIETTVGEMSYNRPLGRFSYQYRDDRAARPTTTFEQPSWVMEAYGGLNNLSKPWGADKQIETPEWLNYYQSLTDTEGRRVSEGPATAETSFLEDIADEFARNYGRQITPQELDYFSGSGTSNLVQAQGLDPKDPRNYVKGIAPARQETVKDILRSYETSPSRYKEQIDPFTLTKLGLDPFIAFSRQGTLENVIGAARSGNPQNYMWQQNRELATTGAMDPLLGKEVAVISGVPIHAPVNKGQTLKIGGQKITDVNDVVNLVRNYGFTSSELQQIEGTLIQLGYANLADYVNRFRTGQIAPNWSQATQQAGTTGEFFDYEFPYAEYSPYKGQISLAGDLQTLGYTPGKPWAGGFVPPKGASGGAVKKVKMANDLDTMKLELMRYQK